LAHLTLNAEISRESGVFFSRISRGNLPQGGFLGGFRGEEGPKMGVFAGFCTVALSLLEKT
jgi:hypothetical protein